MAPKVDSNVAAAKHNGKTAAAGNIWLAGAVLLDASPYKGAIR